ncbi:Ribosomal protein S5 domain 2-type fold subgroup [Penicillium cosmopolitanum]|uniref:4-(cytidine 5'-diphospho)-2-C-methyl-D-erythritol kinase n=1 Tax=Penicillium cosmopolitanum TaxID=1131564 RepID=A0A9W9VQC9_9EURO|nr:Ribosomal protein S5 domain 2-type fold subgroup [Penicillium cosmopolitanum]KAJ5387377.1 Ribosomal protein S5 domain 2-type fold subgroup [Penicillium cosmopolitanum]
MTLTSKSQITLQVPAKVNPQICVGPLRKDGYHDITLAYQAISIYDILTISHAPNGPTIQVTGMDSDRVPSDGQNLVIKAANMVAAEAKIEPLVHFELVKSIPSEAGLGGGSADAAAALVGCNILWNLSISTTDLMHIGAQLGEDVPFFINGMMALGMGHKQPLVPLVTKEYTWNWVLGVPYRGLSTKAVFAQYDEILAQSDNPEEEYLSRRQGCIETPWGTTDPEKLISELVNDLERPSSKLLPDIPTALRAGKTAGAIWSLMSGSGSTCAFLAKDEVHAKSLMIGLQKLDIFRDVRMANGPVEGVKVIDSSP